MVLRRKAGSAFIYAVIIFSLSYANGADLCKSDTSATNQLTLTELGKVQYVIGPVPGMTQISRATCAWQVTAPAGSAILLKITELKWTDYTSGDDCDKENLKIYDGSSTGDTALGDFCEKTSGLPRTTYIFSTGPSIRLVLKTSDKATTTGLTFSVQAVTAEACKGNNVRTLPMASEKAGNFSSPYYSLQEAYPQNALCSWKITAPADKLIKIVFRLPLYVNCDGDAVLVYDGPDNSNDSLIKGLCVQDSFQQYGTTIYSTGPNLFVTFKTGAKYHTDDGFQAFYIAVPYASSCSLSNPKEANRNIMVSSPSGTITSLGFPASIPDVPLECIWKFNASSGHVIRLDIDSLDLSFRTTTCPLKMTITSGGHGNQFDVEAMACSKWPSWVLSSDGRRMWLKYKQTADVNKAVRPSGFSIRYSTVPLVTSGSCSSNSENTIELKGEGATFHSPNHPNQSPSNMKCRWSIAVPDGMLVELRLHSYSTSSNCAKEWIRVYNGATTSSTILFTKCVSGGRHFLYSTGNRMLVEQVTIRGTSVQGFVATFTAVKVAPKASACTGGDRHPTAMSGKLASYGYPGPYSNNAFCRWYITVPFGNIIKLTFTTFSLEESPKCSKDSVQVNGRDKNQYLHELAMLCGKKTTPLTVTSYENEMNIWFKSDQTGRYPGFEAEYVAVADTTFGNCTEQNKDNIIPMSSPTGTFSTPRYPAPFPKNMMCTWVITVDPGHHVRLKISNFDLAFCSWSKVVIRDGDSNGTLIGEYCRSIRDPPVIFSSGRGLWVQFKSTQRGQNGFTAKYEMVPTVPLSISCTDQRSVIKLEGESGALASYEYPLKYQNNVECTWILFSGSSSKRIRLKFESFDLEPSAGCKADYVLVRDGGFPFSDEEGRYCGKSKPDAITSSDSAMFITFKSNGNFTYGGFKATYETTWTVKILVLIGVFATMGAIAVLMLIGWICKCWLSSGSSGNVSEAGVPLNEK